MFNLGMSTGGTISSPSTMWGDANCTEIRQQVRRLPDSLRGPASGF
jgi:hypothetical protein